MRLHELKEARAGKVRECRALVDAANGNALEGEARTKFEKLEREVRDLDGRIESEASVAEMERRTSAATPLGDTMPDLARAVSEFRTNAFLAHISGIPGAPDVGRELEICKHYGQRAGNPEGFSVPLAALLPPREKRALLYGGGSGSGAGLVFEQELPDGIAALRPRTILGRLGATILDGLTGGPVSISKITTGATATFVAEDAAATPNDADTDKVQLQGKTAIALSSVSRNLLTQASPAALALVNADLANAVFGAIDRVGLAGGDTNEPDGVWSLISPSTLDDPYWESILGMIEATEIANAPGARLGFAMHPSAVRVLRSRPKLAFGSPIDIAATGGFVMEGARECAGYPVEVSTFIPTTGSPPSAAGIIYGDFAQAVLGLWESVTLTTNPWSEAEFRRGNVAIRAIATVDVALRYEEAFQTRTVGI